MTCTNIRRMSEADIDDVYAIETHAHLVPWSRNILRDCIFAGYNCLIFEKKMGLNKDLVGYMICRHSDRVCHILNFCIAKSLQSKGYGRDFLTQVLERLAQLKDIDCAMLEVRPSNAIALRLYETMGFKQVEVKPNYYKYNNKVEDAIVLKKIFRIGR